MEIGSETSKMDMVFKNGLMELNMKVNGRTIKQMEKGNMSISMGTYTMENG